MTSIASEFQLYHRFRSIRNPSTLITQIAPRVRINVWNAVGAPFRNQFFRQAARLIAHQTKGSTNDNTWFWLRVEQL